MKTGNISQRIMKMAEFIVIMKYFKFWPYAVLSFFFRLLIEDIVPLLQI
jgi:hypothetical protein